MVDGVVSIACVMTDLSKSQAFSAGDRVRIVELPTYVKTAEPMPMMRPPSVITLGEVGTILNRQPGNEWSVRLEQGAYLLAGRYFEKVEN